MAAAAGRSPLRRVSGDVVTADPKQNAASLSRISRRRRLPRAAATAADRRQKLVFGQFDEENPFVLISSGLLVQPDEGVSDLVVDRIGDLINALNEMVHEYRKLSQTFEEIKAENNGLKNSSVESSTAQLEDTDSLKTELSKLMIENDLLRNRSSELKSENERLNKVMSSWTKSSVSLNKLHEIQKPLNDKSSLGFSVGERSSEGTSTQSDLAYDKFKTMNFVKASVIHNAYESVKYDDQTSGQLNQKGKSAIGYIRPENSKPSWLKNRLEKYKAKAGSKLSIPNQSRCGSKKVKSVWVKVQPQRDLNGPHTKPNLNRSHNISAHTLMDSHTRKTVKVIQVWVPKGDDKVVSTVQGKSVEFTGEVFAGTFELSTEGLTDMSDVPKDLVFDARTAFSYDGEQLNTSCKKREMKFEFHLLNDILAKTVTVKVGSFDVVTHERFLMMSAIYGGVKGAPDLVLRESKDFPPLKILTAKTVGAYDSKNKNITVDVDEPAGDEPVVKKKVASKRRPTPAVVPTPKAQRRRAPKRKLVLPIGSDGEKEPDVRDVVDDVDQIIVQTSIAFNDEDDNLDGAENEIARKIASFTAPKQFLKEPLRSGEDDDMSGSKQTSKITEPAAAEKDKEIEPVATEDLSLAKSVATMTDSEDTEPLSKALELNEKPSTSDEELMSLEDLLKQIHDDMMMPSVTAAEPTKIKFGQGIEIREVDLYKASLPQIAADYDKGKEPLVVDTIQGNTAREIFSLICADIDFVVQLREQLREQVIEDVVKFFNSFSFRRLAVLDSVKDIAAKEELVLTWAETDSVHIALQRRQVKEHKLEWTQPYSSHLFEGPNVQLDFFILRSNTKFKSTCWIRTMFLADGSWLIAEGVVVGDPFPVQDLDSRSPFSRLVRDYWTEVCVAVVQFSLFRFLQPVGTVNRCRDIIGPVVDIEEVPSGFRGVFQHGVDTDSLVDFFNNYVVQPVRHLDSVTADPIVQIETDQNPYPIESDSFSQRNPDTVLNSPSPSTSADSLVHLTTDDIPLGSTDSKTSLPLEILESKREVRTQYVILTTYLADIRKEVQDQKATMLVFREESQEHYSTLREHLAEIIDYINIGRDDKRGKVVAAEVRSRLRTIRADLVVVVVAEVNLQEKEEMVVRKVVLDKETGDIDLEGTDYWTDLDNCIFNSFSVLCTNLCT
ncbi:splicing factor 3B subunit 1-like [Dorcoceras hygrometricum]|nr:splicing factor 3B subunit 1-like [Dorcoceras hygrometricum]